jgi:DNA-binding transcriptional regulator YdaS (Cro superfamily)
MLYSKAMNREILQKTVDCFGTKAEMARQLGVKPQMITIIWRNNHVPANHCKKIELLTGGRITAEMLRPDIFAPNKME